MYIWSASSSKYELSSVTELENWRSIAVDYSRIGAEVEMIVVCQFNTDKKNWWPDWKRNCNQHTASSDSSPRGQASISIRRKCTIMEQCSNRNYQATVEEEDKHQRTRLRKDASVWGIFFLQENAIAAGSVTKQVYENIKRRNGQGMSKAC